MHGVPAGCIACIALVQQALTQALPIASWVTGCHTQVAKLPTRAVLSRCESQAASLPDKHAQGATRPMQQTCTTLVRGMGGLRASTMRAGQPIVVYGRASCWAAPCVWGAGSSTLRSSWATSLCT